VTPLVFAFGAGLLATVNPCGFAMLPAFLGFYVGDGDRDRSSMAARVWQGLDVGAAVSVGFAGVFIATGLLVAAGLRALLSAVPYAAAIIGLGLVGVGVAMARGAHIGLPAMDRLRPGQSRSRRRMVVFGAAYAVASLSCTLAVLLAVVAQALATASLLGIVAVFAAYGAGAATVLIALALSAALAREALARRIGRLLPLAGRMGGLLLVASGVYLIVYWLPVVVGARPNSGLAGFSAGWSARATTFLEGHTGAFGYLAMALLVGAGILAWPRWRGVRRPTSIESTPPASSSKSA
jgi:cytochrome c biogenesis protein CcdA